MKIATRSLRQGAKCVSSVHDYVDLICDSHYADTRVLHLNEFKEGIGSQSPDSQSLIYVYVYIL